MITDKKKQLRQEILQKRNALSMIEREEKSRQISKQVIAHPRFLQANKILLFSSFRSEVSTKEIFEIAVQMGKQVYFPKVMGKEMEFYQVKQEEELTEGCWGILEPQPEEIKRFLPQFEDKVFVVMPASVVDKAGGRIGYGGGYYDKYLEQLEDKLPKENIYKVAIAFACQMVEEGVIPREVHDIQPNEVITEPIYWKCATLSLSC